MGRLKLLLLLAFSLSVLACGTEKAEKRGGSSAEKAQMKADTLFKSTGDGTELIRYPNGNKKLTGHYENGKRHGVWSSWYKDGNLKSELRYRHGKRHGFYKTWYKNGKIRYEGQYHHGKRSGVWRFYDKEGELVRKKDFGPEGSKDQGS